MHDIFQAFRYGCFALLAILLGCASQPSTPTPAPSAETPPRVLVVGDEPLAAAIAATWKANTETDVEVTNVTVEKLASAKRLPADVLVFPTGMLGELIQNQLIVPTPADFTSEPSWNRTDVFENARRQEIQWGRETYALPLGFPPLVLGYRSDLLAARQLKPPQTWPELTELAAKLSTGDDKFPGLAVQLPLAEGEAGYTFLTHAANYVCDASQLAVLFDHQSMEPLITSPPYVRALTELVALARPGEAAPVATSADEIWQGMFAGKFALGVTRMGLAGDNPPPRGDVTIDVAPLPGSREVFRFAKNNWEPRTGVSRATLIGSHGTLVAVTADARRPKNAWGFAAWLTNAEASARLIPHSKTLAPFRKSHQGSLGKVVDSRLTADAAQHYFSLLHEGEQDQALLVLPRIPSWPAYLQTLDAAVRAAVFDKVPPEEALKTAAVKWQEITIKMGTNGQRKAYLEALAGATR